MVSDGSIDCGDGEAKFGKDGKAEIYCKGSVSFGDESSTKLPVEFTFSYPYKITRIINYRVMPSRGG